MESQRKSGLVQLLFGIALGLAPWGLGLIGVIINQWLGAIVLACAFALMAWAFWIWEKVSRWPIAIRVATISLAALVCLYFAGRQIVSTYRQPIEPPLSEWVFKDSLLFTQEQKVHIATEITKFRQYLGTVGFDTGNEMPPIEVISAENPTGSYAATFGGPVYYDSLKLKANQLDNGVAITSAYSSYYFIKILMEPVFRLPDQGVCTWGGGSKHNQFSAFTFELYFNWSFWGKRTEDANLPSVLAFWEMRGRFGKESTDRLVAFTAKAFIDNTCGDKSADWEQYFYERVRIADQIVDSESSKLPAIKEILGRFGIQPQ